VGVKDGMKMMVLGFDGASPKLIDEWIDQLPMLGQFKGQGILGQTIPPVPAQTPVAWTTFMTGKNPGNHGIFSFATRTKGTYERAVISPGMLEAKTLWRILSDAGRRVSVINVPMSDAEEVRGFIIPGFLSRSEGIPNAEGIRAKLKREFDLEKLQGDLEVEALDKVETDPDSFFSRVNEITDEMAAASLFLLREEEWDFFMPVFMGLDRIQHFFWRYVDAAHPRHVEGKYSRSVRDFYVKVDGIIGEFMKSADEDTMIMVISDHGFCPVHTEVIVNDYLEDLGFLTTRAGKIDLEEGKAISYGYGDMWLNVKGREPRGRIDPGEEYELTRDRIIEGLEAIAIDGRRPIKAVRKREEIWHGPYVGGAPDLTIFFEKGYQAARRPEITAENALRRYVNENPRWSGGHDGTHDPEDVPGIIGMLGPGIPRGSSLRVRLWDVAPTILRLMGVPIPADMDGKPFL
jgi:predicted AlkP superfamily phosphohydrolase/phosphomutase